MSERYNSDYTGAEVDEGIRKANEAFADLPNKANTDGYYQGLTSGNAEQLIGSVFEEDKVPYLFRTSGGTASIGDRVKEKKVIGGTVNVNQMVDIDNVMCSNSGTIVKANGEITYTVGTPSPSSSNSIYITDFNFQQGKKYLLSANVKNNSEASISAGHRKGNDAMHTMVDIAAKTSKQISIILTPEIDLSGIIYRLRLNTSACSIGDTIEVSEWDVIDLTAWFGSAIADTITTAEKAYALGIPRTYIPYNAGTLMSVNLLKKVVTGINQWDEEWEVGAYATSTGRKTSGQNQIRSKNKIPVIPSMQYYLSIPNATSGHVAAMLYDKNENYIGFVYCGNNTFTLPSNAYYITFYTGTSMNYGEVYKHDICINLSWNGSHNGEYHPYEKTEYAMPSGELRGIPKLDANGKLYYDGDEYFADGTINRRYAIVDLGTADWTFDGDGRFHFDLPTMNLNTPLICSAYRQATNFVADKIIANSNYWYSPNNVVVYDNSYSDTATFKAAMNGEYLVYELDTPTTEQGTPYNEIQKVDDWGTEEFVTAEGNIVPVGHESDYFANLRDKLQNLPGNASADGDYIVRQTGSQQTLVPVPTELPNRSALASDKTYALKVVNGTLQWVEEA